MPSALSDPTVSAVLDRLFADAEVTDAPLRAIEEAGSEGDAPATPQPGSDIEALLAKSNCRCGRLEGWSELPRHPSG
jgi:hypothetical protein